MASRNQSRRKFLERCSSIPLCWLGTFLLFQTSCRSDPQESGESATGSCTDFSKVPENDLALRKSFAYVESSPVPDSRCDNCKLWLPPKEGQECGGCLLFKGPVYAAGHCTYWAPVE